MKNDNVITTPDNIEIYENKIYMLCDDYINTLPDPNNIYNNRCFTGMIKYIYRYYIGDLLNNKNNRDGNRYNNIQLLDSLFYIYVDISYKYNNIPTILEFSLFIGINRDTIQTWKNNTRRELTPEYAVTVKKWYEECELAQVKEKDVKSIFLLKSNYNYNDNLQAIPLENQGVKTSIEQLPVLGVETDDQE